MLKFENISDNIIEIIDRTLSNVNVCKYVYYSGSKPLEQDGALNFPKLMLFNLVFPYPFDERTDEIETVQLRIYSPSFDLKTRTTDCMKINFDIIMPKTKDFWRIIVDNTYKLRPYEIAKELVNELGEINIGGGNLNFQGAKLFNVNQKYNQLTLFGEISSVTSGKR